MLFSTPLFIEYKKSNGASSHKTCSLPFIVNHSTSSLNSICSKSKKFMHPIRNLKGKVGVIVGAKLIELCILYKCLEISVQ